jgi:hypothetical protein
MPTAVFTKVEPQAKCHRNGNVLDAGSLFAREWIPGDQANGSRLLS